MKRFESKVAFITGAASGIGRATAERLAREGASLAIADINDAGLEITAGTCREAGARVIVLNCNVGDYASCQQAIDRCLDEFGQLDVLCNIAGICQFKHFTDYSIEDWQRMLAINLSGVFYLCQLAMPALRESQGNIVNLASSAALVGQAYQVPYCATKAAVLNLSKALAVEYSGSNVRVNAICPGHVETPLVSNLSFPDDIDAKLLDKLTPLLASAKPAEIAAAVAYLASGEARFVTGAALSIDGGQVAG